jgi:hypothetical protein
MCIRAGNIIECISPYPQSEIHLRPLPGSWQINMIDLYKYVTPAGSFFSQLLKYFLVGVRNLPYRCNPSALELSKNTNAATTLHDRRNQVSGFTTPILLYVGRKMRYLNCYNLTDYQNNNQAWDHVPYPWAKFQFTPPR